MSFLDKIFGDPDKKYLKNKRRLVRVINDLEKDLEDLSSKELQNKTKEFKKRLEQEPLDNILPAAFAVVREASKRTLGQRHYDEQLLGGITMHEGNIAEMKTGEGKTLAATLPLYLNALEEKGVHLVTVNDYLAKRDTVWMGQVYHYLGMSVGCITSDTAYIYSPPEDDDNETLDEKRDRLGSFKVIQSFLKEVPRKKAYQADITYGTNNQFGFDYLRDNLVLRPEQKTQRKFNFAILDEIDSILIDEARTPLIISSKGEEAGDLYKRFAKIVPRLDRQKHYDVDEESKSVTLTEEGIEKMESILGIDNIYEEKGFKYLHHIEQSLKAEVLFQKDHDYVIKKGEVIIVDEFTGRLMPGRRWSGGLHQAIEAKENVEIKAESSTLASISFQSLFRKYDKLAGMTGTAKSSSEEFDKVYGLRVIQIPTHKELIRKSLSDRVYKTEAAKFRAIVRAVKERHEKGQPILIGTVSIEKNEQLSGLLQKEGIEHELLNAKNHEKEGEVIAQAGSFGAVTVATNMAGRGVDIILGGNPPDKEEAQKVKDLGGLHVIGSERHEARRIDNQLRGRSGRQGDPGSSRFYVSLEDDLVRIFGGDKVSNIMEKFNLPEDQPIEMGMISNLIESAQQKVEGKNFDVRKRLLEYDEVTNKHRNKIYGIRNRILESDNLRSYILELFEEYGYDKEKYKEKEEEIGEEPLQKAAKVVALKTIDIHWMEHIEKMNNLKDSVRLRAYGQRDPLVEYKHEGHKLFKRMLNEIKSLIPERILKLEAVPKEEKRKIQASKGGKLETKSNKSQQSKQKAKKDVGRNDPCPCGSGKKYKKCCWPKWE